MKNQIATLTEDNATITLVDADVEMTVDVASLHKRLKSGAQTFISQKEFREKHDLSNAKAKRVYKAALNAVGKANKAVLSKLLHDDGLIMSKSHRKTNKKGEFAGWGIELKPTQEIPAMPKKKAAASPKDGKSFAESFGKLSTEEKKIALAELGLA